MSLKERLVTLASGSQVASKNRIHVNVPFNLEAHALLADISRATGLSITKLVVDLINSKLDELQDIAQAVKKVAPAERFEGPLRRSKAPRIKDLEAFVTKKKRRRHYGIGPSLRHAGK